MINILLSPAEVKSAVVEHIEQLGAHAIIWPQLGIDVPADYSAIDEAIENLFGYDWLILKNNNAVHFFLQRLRELNHDLSELDTIRVCAVDDPTFNPAGPHHIHIDVPIEPLSSSIFESIESYVGNREMLQGLNFLVPCAGLTHERFEHLLEDARARVDHVIAYRTTSQTLRLAQVMAMMAGGGLDRLLFTSARQLDEFAELVDSTDLGHFLADTVVVCAGEQAIRRLAEFGARVTIPLPEFSSPSLVRAIVNEPTG